MKKAIVLLVCVCMVFALFACTPAAPTEKSEGQATAEETTSEEGTPEKTESTGSGSVDGSKIGYACNNLNDTFQTYIADAAKASAEQLGMTVDLQDGQEDVIKQQDQVKAMIVDGANAIIAIPVDTSAAQPMTKEATEAGIPLVYVNRNPFGDSEPPEGVFYIGTNEPQAGQLQAEQLMKLLPDGGNICILQGMLTNEAAIKRTEGFEQAIDQSKFKILAKEVGDWQRDKGMSVTENWLTAYGEELNVIIANNDEMALGAVQAVKAAGRDDIIIIGVDATPDARQAVADGTMAATVLQDPVEIGGGAVEIVKKALEGTKQDAITWMPFILVTPENIDQYK